MMIPFLIVSALVPSLLLIWFFHARDLYPEPQRVVWATFGLGVFTIPWAIGIELAIAAAIKHVKDPFLAGSLDGFVCAGMTEEVLKYLVVVYYCMRHKEFDEPMDGIVYGSVASLGFATLENFFYVVKGGEMVAIFRAFTAVPGHAFMGAIMGYFVGQAKFTPAKRKSLMVKALVIPMLLHGAYDAPLLTFQRISADKHHTQSEMLAAGLFALVTLAVLVFESSWTLVLTSRMRRQQLDWSARRWAAYYAHQPQPPPPWELPGTSPAPATAPAPVVAAAPALSPLAPVAAGVPRYVPTPSAPQGSAAAGWVMLTFGGLLACGGGLMTLGAAMLILDPTSASGGATVSPAAYVAVGIFLGILPLGVGLLLFGFGVRRLARTSSMVAPPAMAYGRPA
jgi:protease PrsW